MKRKYLAGVVTFAAILILICLLAVPVTAKPYQIDVTVKNSTGAPLPNYWITYQPQGGSMNLPWVITNLRGKALLSVPKTLSPGAVVDLYINPATGTFCSLCPSSGPYTLNRQNSGRITFIPCTTPGETLCTSGCSNLQSDTGNCGSCGTTCSVPNSNPGCAQGACTIGSCTGVFDDCNGLYGDGCESDTFSDTGNCGSCGTACAAVDNGNPSCSVGACTIGSCDYGFADCDGQYETGCEIDTSTSADHCGFCGNACYGSEVAAPSCSGGVCSVDSCNAGFGDCDSSIGNGCEVDLTSDVQNCGGCLNACPDANGVASCSGEVCGITCDSGYMDCYDFGGFSSGTGISGTFEGCETHTDADILNCGACGNVCPAINGAATCDGGTCGITCDTGFENCNGELSDGCEADKNNDIFNCGSCGTLCSGDGGSPSCSGGTCDIACDQDYANCDGNISNGCEADLNTDVSNCGGCDTVCSSEDPFAAITCNAGACHYS